MKERSLEALAVRERMNPFDDSRAVARYADGLPSLVPGFVNMQRMGGLLGAVRPGCSGLCERWGAASLGAELPDHPLPSAHCMN